VINPDPDNSLLNFGFGCLCSQALNDVLSASNRREGFMMIRHVHKAERFRYTSFRNMVAVACSITVVLFGASNFSNAAEPWVSAYLVGVNLAGAGFNTDKIKKGGPRGQHGVDYVYPIEPFAPGYQSPQYFVSKGMNTFRLSFAWERLQPQLGKMLDVAEAQRLIGATDKLLSLGAWVILDLHNYARYDDMLIGSTQVTIDHFADVWRRAASLFKDKGRVLFGLMNEPHNMSTETWVQAANSAIRSIRNTGAENLILVPGNHWSSAKAWYETSYGQSNAEALLNIVDPLDRVVFEAHTYLDSDSSGTSAVCISESVGVERLEPFTRWLSEHGKLGFVGEFGGGKDPVCLKGLAAMARMMMDRSDVYLGWTFWAAGPWWPQEYFSLIEPLTGDAPQMTALLPYLRLPRPPKPRLQ
jgi:endoglucanase